AARDDRQGRSLTSRLERRLEVLQAERDRLRAAGLNAALAGSALGRLFRSLCGRFGGQTLLLGAGPRPGRPLGLLAFALGFLGAPLLELARLAALGGFDTRLLASGKIRIARLSLLLGLFEKRGPRFGLGFQAIGQIVSALQRFIL